MKTVEKKEKIICDLCINENKAHYKCNTCNKDMCSQHRYYIGYIKKISKYNYKQIIVHNLCSECYYKINNIIKKVGK